MAEFVFRNLSVKLFPVADAVLGPVCVCCSYAHECDECSFCTEGVTDPPCDPCTGGATDVPGCGPCTDGPTEEPPGCEGPSDDCFPCTEFDTSPCTFSDEGPCAEPLSCVQESGCFEDSDLPILLGAQDAPAQPAAARASRSPDVIQAELDVLRVELRAALGLPPDADPQRRAEPAPAPGEIDRVRSALLAAVDELDRKRGRAGDDPWPG